MAIIIKPPSYLVVLLEDFTDTLLLIVLISFANATVSFKTELTKSVQRTFMFIDVAFIKTDGLMASHIGSLTPILMSLRVTTFTK